MKKWIILTDNFMESQKVWGIFKTEEAAAIAMDRISHCESSKKSYADCFEVVAIECELFGLCRTKIKKVKSERN